MAKAFCLGERKNVLAIFNKQNFEEIIYNIELMEKEHQNIWVPIGILEMMYDDYAGLIDQYFHTRSEKRNVDRLYSILASIDLF